MRISELARTADVPLPTVKFYLREGLLPAGRQLSATRADYGEAHVDRLRLVRALIDVGGLPLAAVRAVLGALDSGPDRLGAAVATAHGALPPEPPEGLEPRRALELVHRLGWSVGAGTPALRQLELALGVLEELGMDVHPRRLTRYARAVGRLAEVEVAAMPSVPAARPEDAVRFVVLGTVLYEPVLLALRRLAQQHHFATRISGGADGEGPGRGPGPSA